MMTETEDASLVFDLEAVLRADGDGLARWPLPQINPLDDVSTLESDTIGGTWMSTPKKSYSRVAPTNQDIDQAPPKKQAPIKGDSRDGRTTKRIFILCIVLGPVLFAVICGLAIVLARLRQEEVESSQSASWWDIPSKPAPVTPPIDGGDDAPLPSPSTFPEPTRLPEPIDGGDDLPIPSPSTFPLAEPTRLSEEPATTTPAYPTNGPAPSSSASIPTDTPGESTYAPLSPSPSPSPKPSSKKKKEKTDGGDHAPLPSPSTFPLVEPTRLPRAPTTTTTADHTNGLIPSSSTLIPSYRPGRSTYAPLLPSPSPTKLSKKKKEKRN